MSPYIHRCQMRWGDMDAQGHVNNAAYVDYLQEARVAFLLSGPPALHHMLDSGILVVSHQLEYLRPVIFSERPLIIDLWVDAIGGSRFSIGYALDDGDQLAARARTVVVPFDLARSALRRLTTDERELLGQALAPAEPLRPLPRVGVLANDHRYPLTVRWSDLDSYGHVNNVKYYDYIQEARISLVNHTVRLGTRGGLDGGPPGPGVPEADRFPDRTVRGGYRGFGNRQPLLHPGCRDPRSSLEHRLRDCPDRRGGRFAVDRRSAVGVEPAGPDEGESPEGTVADYSRKPGIVPGCSSKVFTIEYAARSM